MDLFHLITTRLKMGCSCSKESVQLEGTTYKVLEHLAEGGFSNIDLVEHPRTRQKFALKRIVCHSTEDQISAQREIEFHKHFDHPNVLKCVASAIVGRADIVHNQTSEVQLLLPFFPKGTLHDELQRRMKTNSYFSEKLALRMFDEICSGILSMHNAKPNALAHRDIKPHNVLITKDFKPVIMDLGSTAIAQVKIQTHSQAQHLQDVAAERSSMPYRPPELFQVNSKCDIDERTDVWSLGCLLYAICFFKSPYDAVYERGDSVALAVQSANLTFPPGSPFTTDVHNLITWMLTPEIAVRPHLCQIRDRLKDMLSKTEDIV